MTIARRCLYLALSVSLAFACTQQAAGQRCDQNSDCNGSAGEVCRSYNNPAASCEMTRDRDSGVPSSCICCPQDSDAAAGISACQVTRVTTDAAVGAN